MLDAVIFLFESIPGNDLLANRVHEPEPEPVAEGSSEHLGDDDARVSGAVALGSRAQDAFTYQRDTLSAWASMLLFYNHVRGEIETDLLVIFFDSEDRVREISFRSVSRNP